ncbi:MAG: hypothetical protein ACHQHN_01105 [Sphingobacteriales bacterium]
MENQAKITSPENDLIQIKAINEDSYWAKEYGISSDVVKNMDYHTGIFDVIVDSHIKTQNSNN